MPLADTGNPAGPLVIGIGGSILMVAAGLACAVDRRPHTQAGQAVSPSRRRGLPSPLQAAVAAAVLAIGTAATLAICCGLAKLTTLQTSKNPVHDPIYRYFLNHRAGWLTSLLKVVTHLGDYSLLYPLAVVAGIAVAVVLRRPTPLILIPLILIGEKYLQLWTKKLVPTVKPPSCWPSARSVAAPPGEPPGRSRYSD